MSPREYFIPFLVAMLLAFGAGFISYPLVSLALHALINRIFRDG